MDNIRNFTIIAHIDHGKSTLADRMLEMTSTVEKRKMRDQVLDSMELERERGITIKMQPVRMEYKGFELNLIDTPGHIDFSYEVSRALRAVEGALLLVDATQGVQAQTLTTLSAAKDAGLTIIPVLNKIDSQYARVAEVKKEMVGLLGCEIDEILETSGKTGQGVSELLEHITKVIPAPKSEIPSDKNFRSLVFDFEYSDHRGVIVYVRVTNGSVKKGDAVKFHVAKKTFSVLEVGTFSPDAKPVAELKEGEIGYVVTGIKEAGIAAVGDTVSAEKDPHPPLPGYAKPVPVVWASLYPENQDDFEDLKQSLRRLQLSDSSLSYEEETSGVLGRGFRCGFLGMLHLEIITERLKREFNLELVVTMPTITYRVILQNGKEEVIYSPHLFPDDGLVREIFEPWVSMQLISPNEYIGQLLQLLYEHEAIVGHSDTFGPGRTAIDAEMPLRELMRNFFDKVKSATSGFASISYKPIGERVADVVRLDVLVADEPVAAFARVVSKRVVQEEAERLVERLHKVLPRQMFTTKIQGKAVGRILSSRTLSAYKKDVTQHMYGGDITRKMKLRERQKEGKKRMQARGKVNIPHDVFMKMVRDSGDKS